LVEPNVGDPPPAERINFTDHPEATALQPGEYVIDYADPVALVTFTVPDEPYQGQPSPFYKGESDWGPWHQDHMARLGAAEVENLYVDPCNPTLGLRDPPVGPSVEELITALGEVPGLQVSTPVEAELGGIPGQHVELTGVVPDGCVEEPFIWTTTRGDASLLLPGTGDSGHAWIYDVDGQRLVIWLRVDAGRTDDGGAIDDLLDSIVIEAP
jgi:hypothetical protein